MDDIESIMDQIADSDMLQEIWDDPEISLRPEQFAKWKDPAFRKASAKYGDWLINGTDLDNLSEDALEYVRLLAPRGEKHICLLLWLIYFHYPWNGVYYCPVTEDFSRRRVALYKAMFNEAVAHL
jgi:hypothetical protein